MISKITETDFEKLCADPSAHYKHPEAVVKDDRLTRSQKIAVLKLWAFDAHEMEVAQEENMQPTQNGNGTGHLHEVLKVLRGLEEKGG